MSTITPTPRSESGKRRLTAGDLLSMPDGGEGLELVDGELVRKKMGGKSSYVNCRVSRILAGHVDDRQLGLVFDSECGYRCFPHDTNRVRKPDVSFVRSGRLKDDEPPDGWIDIVPDLAVEVISSKDRAEKLNAKLADYRSVGVPIVWVVDPGTRTVVVYVAGESMQRLFSADDILTGGDVLPDFSVKVSDLFPPKRNAGR